MYKYTLNTFIYDSCLCYYKQSKIFFLDIFRFSRVSLTLQCFFYRYVT